METVKINVNVDKQTKHDAEVLFEAIGMNMTTAINVFLRKAVQSRGIPFDVCVEIPNEVTVEAFKEGDAIIANPDRVSYSSVEELRKALK